MFNLKKETLEEKAKIVLRKAKLDIIKILNFAATNKQLDAAEEKGIESAIIAAAASKGIILTSEQVEPLAKGIVEAFNKVDIFLEQQVEKVNV
jgi:hypothetical protein